MRHLLWNPQWDRLPYCTTQLLPAGEFLELVYPNQDPELVCAPSTQLYFGTISSVISVDVFA